MLKVGMVAVFLAFWAAVILGSMYLTGTWYPLVLAVPFLYFTVQGDHFPPANGNDKDGLTKP